MRQPNWLTIKDFLNENFVTDDFTKYPQFQNIDFENALAIFKYILNLKSSNHNETKAVLEAFQDCIDGKQNQEVLDKLLSKFEPFTKKIFEVLGQAGTPGKPVALGWCYNLLFKKLQLTRVSKDKFFATVNQGKIEVAQYESKIFEGNFLPGNIPHGKSLHKTYHLRNSQIHNDQHIKIREIPDAIHDCIISYLFFVFSYYTELSNAIPSSSLDDLNLAEIITLASLSGGAYNPNIENEVFRDGIIQTIENKLKTVHLLFLEGGAGIGKTTVLHQFLEKHPNTCFSYFIDSKDKNTFSTLSLLQAFCNQLHFYLKGRELQDEIPTEKMFDESFLKDYFHSIKLKAPTAQSLYFIVDGLDEIEEEYQMEIKENLLDLIPSKREHIKLILTGKIGNNIIPEKIKSEGWEIPLLSGPESKTIFGKSATSAQFLEINKICHNNAGKLVFIRELTNSNISLPNIIDNISGNINDLYAFLWNEFYDKNDKLLGLVLAIISFEGKKYSIDKIARILSSSTETITIAQLNATIEKVPFIRRNQRNTYEFIFEGLANFAKQKLSNFKKNIDNIIIKYLISNSDSKEALVNLPEMYKDTGKVDDLLKLLGEDRWKQLLEKSESISDVSRVSNIALQAVKDQYDNRYIPTILKYSVLKSALKELNQTSIWQYEIAANLSLGDDINAINLANIAFLKEDRLKLFASIAKTYTQKNTPIPDNIVKTIQELYSEIDFKSMGNVAVELASLLMYSNAKLAFQLIEDLSGSISDNDNAFDWALAQMSLSAHKDFKESEDVTKEDVTSKVYSKIRNPQIKEFADAVLYLSENQTLEEIIEKIKELESTSQKLFLIRNWILNNKKDKNISKIIDLGIDLVIDKSDKYVPKANDFKIFAIPLPNIEDKTKATELIDKIEQQILAIEFASSINDILFIKLLIAQCVCNFDFEEGEKKLSSIYDEIQLISDLALKGTCLAIYANSATKIKNKFPEREVEIYADSARDDIKNSIDNILNQTAEHFEIVQGIITNLVQIYPYTVIEICQKLNKSIDRDNAYLESLSTYLRKSLGSIDTSIVDDFLESITDLDIRKLALFEIFQRIENGGKEQKIPSTLHKYFALVDDILDNESKCSLYVSIISILEKEALDISAVSAKLKGNWHELETSASKIELGFEIAFKASFLEHKDLGRYFLRKARSEKENPLLLLDSPNTAAIFFLSIELAIKLFAGLVLKGIATEKDLLILEPIINSLPSETQQLQLWSSLALKIAPKATENLPRIIIQTYIISKLSKIKNRAERIDAIMEIIPVLYLADPQLQILDELPSAKFKDIALSKVCKYLLTNCLPHDLCDDNDEGFAIDYETLKKILALVKRMSNDYFIAWQIDELRKSITAANTKISSQQIIEIKKEIEEIALNNLPDNNNIKHKGYQILVKAYAISIQRQTHKEEWNNILEEIEDVPNLSDKIFLWISLSSIIPSKHEYLGLKQSLIDKSSNLSYNLPSFLDTVGRVSMILMVLMSKKIDGINLKSILGNFLDIQRQKDISPKLRDKYRNILNVAYSADPEIARVFLNIFDNDPARKNTGAYLSNHLNYLEFQSKLDQKVDQNKSEKDLIEQRPMYFNQIIDKKLALLNGSKTINDNLFPKDLIYQLDIASQKSIYDSHNAFSYFIERLVLKYENTNEAEKLIKKSYTGLLEVCNLIKLLSIRNADKIKSLFDIITADATFSQDRDVVEVKKEIGDDNYSNTLKLIAKDFTSSEIASMLKIDIDSVNIILKSIKS